MEKNEISLHQLSVFEHVRKSAGWQTAKEVAKGAGVAERTARLHCLNLVNLGVFDQAEVFPAHRYRISAKAGKRNKSYMLRIAAAKEAFGIWHPR